MTATDPPDKPDWAAQLQAAAQTFAEQMTHATHILAAQGAMGWLYRGDLDKARDTLTKLPPDALQQVSVAATALAALADEVAAATDPGAQ